MSEPRLTKDSLRSGAWIETNTNQTQTQAVLDSLRSGAWIETKEDRQRYAQETIRSAQERGLKLGLRLRSRLHLLIRSAQERGLKQERLVFLKIFCRIRSAQERGLKLCLESALILIPRFAPLRSVD